MALVASSELAIFATKSSCRDQILVPATSPRNSNWFEFVGLVAGTKVGFEAKMASSHNATGPCN